MDYAMCISEAIVEDRIIVGVVVVPIVAVLAVVKSCYQLSSTKGNMRIYLFRYKEMVWM